jgi:hypothetical protein
VKRAALLFLIAVLSLGLILSLPWETGVAQSDDNGIKMQAEAAYQGVVKNGEWLPIWITLENNGPDREAEARVRVTSGNGAVTYAVPVPLPTGARKRVPLYVLPNSFSREMEVQLVADDELLAQTVLNVQPQMNISYVVGILAPERGATGLISGITLPGQFRPIVLVDLAAQDLPEKLEGLRSFDAILINDFDTSTLSQEQRTTLQNWVQSGGRLIVGGGAGAQKSVSGLPEALVLANPDSLVELDEVSALSTFAGGEEIRVPGPFLAAVGSQNAGATLVQQDNVPLLQEAQLGNGKVNYISLDLAGAPFDAWSGATDFWQALLSPGSAYPTWLAPDVPQRQMIADQMNYALTSLPALDLPSVRGLAILLAIYVLLVGPVNYLVLRAFKRLQLAWITIPALTLLFSAGTFAIGFALRGNDVILNKIALIEVQPDGSGNAATYFGLFSPEQRAYEVQVPNSGLLSTMNTYYDPWTGGPSTPGEITFVQGDPALVQGLSVNQWSMQAFQAESTWQDFGRVTADLQMSQAGLTGEVTNDTRQTLKDAMLVLGARHTAIGDLAPGETRTVDLPIPEETGFRYSGEIGWMLFEDQYSGAIQPPRDLEVKRNIVNAVFQYNSSPASSSSRAGGSGNYNQKPVLLGWLDSAPPEVLVNDRQVAEQTTALVYQALDYQLADGPEVWLPVGTIPGGLVEYPIEGGNCGMDNISVWLGRGDAVFGYQIPENLQNINPETLRLSIRSDGGWTQLPTVSVYAWDENAWVDLEGAASGINIVGDADRYVDAAGNIKVRLSTQVNQGGGCLYVELGMQGSRQ